ncbi:MAG: glycoside hydrolase domain-containing protein, partial [Phocaeicola sp.]
MQVKHLSLFCAAWALSMQLTAQSTQQQVDPNHLATGGYGKLIAEKPEATIWWAEGAYKVMQDAPTPSKKEGRIELSSAKNEWESFILVFNPKHDIENLKISLSTFESKEGTLDASAVTVRKVEYVNVTHPTDSYTFKGQWPDPLPLYKEGETLKAGRNQPYWISIKTPKEAQEGVYTATVTVTGDGFKEEIPIKLNVWNFALPDSPTMRSGFGLNLENVKKYNNLHTPQDIQKGFDTYMEAFRDYKISPYNPFELTPIKEHVSGVEWQGGFFDSKNNRNGKYSYMVVDKSLTSNVEASLRTP